MPDYRFGLDNYIAARVWDERLNDKPPSNWYQVSSKMFNYSVEKRDYSINSGVHALDSFADEAAIKNGWAVYCHQGIGDYADDWAYIAIDTLEKHLDYLYNNKDKFWVENFGNVVRYIKERDAVSIKQTDSTNYGFTIFVNDTLDNEIYNYPLTIRMLILGTNWAGTFDIPTPIADGKEYVYVRQNRVISNCSIVTEGEKQYVVFNVIPDGGEIKIMNLKTHENTKHAFLDKTAAPFCTVKNRMLQVNRGHFGNTSLSVGIFDINGRMLAKHNLESKESSVTLDAGKISRSAFIVKISDGVTSHTQRLLPQF